MDDKKQIEVCIADCAPIPMLVNIDEIDIANTAQESVTHLWKVWKSRYRKEKSPYEVMAMVAFRYAMLYYSKEANESNLKSLLESFEKDLDSQLLKTE